ncbi:MAG: GrpB family protein [Thermoleophilia bacterium]|nr:GrpB family protein [Thermoleophilia bacterium]
MSAPDPEKLARVLAEEVAVVDYDPGWPGRFAREVERLRGFFPVGMIRRVEHFGSTAVPGLAAKPIVDILVAVDDLERVRAEVAPALEAAGYDFFWRPAFGDDGPRYPWFIARDAEGRRTAHIHVVRPGDEHWGRLRFRDHLRAHPDVAARYGALKRRLAADLGHDRVAYTAAKAAFVAANTPAPR